MDSFYLNTFKHKLFWKGKKNYFLSILGFSLKSLKLKKIKPILLYFILIEILKPFFFIMRTKQKRKKKKVIKRYKPFFIRIERSLRLSTAWFLIPFFIQIRILTFANSLSFCFLNFFRSSFDNLAVKKKLSMYRKILKFRPMLRF